jgi:hypothetical protein
MPAEPGRPTHFPTPPNVGGLHNAHYTYPRWAALRARGPPPGRPGGVCRRIRPCQPLSRARLIAPGGLAPRSGAGRRASPVRCFRACCGCRWRRPGRSLVEGARHRCRLPGHLSVVSGVAGGRPSASAFGSQTGRCGAVRGPDCACSAHGASDKAWVPVWRRSSFVGHPAARTSARVAGAPAFDGARGGREGRVNGSAILCTAGGPSLTIRRLLSSNGTCGSPPPAVGAPLP